MAVVNNENIIYEKSDIVDLSPNIIPTLKGNQIIGVSRPGDIQAEAPQLDSIVRPIQSPNFQAGTKGWRLNSNGILEAYDAVIT